MNNLIIERLKAINDPNSIKLFFQLLRKLIQELKLSPSNEKLSLNVRNDYRKRFSVNMNSRLVLSIVSGEQESLFQFMINEEGLAKIRQSFNIIQSGNFGRQTNAALITINAKELFANDTSALISDWISSCKKYEPVQEKSQYRKHHIPDLYEMAMYDNVLNNYLNELDFKINEMTIWKLGCNWETGYPDFYEFLKSKHIVIGVENSLYAEGDLIAVTQGYTVRAVAKVLETPSPVTSNIQLEADFENLKIPYDTWVNFAKVEWHELLEDQVFTYEIRKGIIRIQKPEIKERILKLWQNKLFNATMHTTNSESIPLNQIIYGPPGTGKTYHTINKAVSIANPFFNIQGYSREELRQEYQRLCNEGQIVFTTFHQSMSYEDFIEGIKPLPPTIKGNVQYDIIPGLFKEACAKAAYYCHIHSIKLEQKEKPYSFENLYKGFVKSLRASLNKMKKPEFTTLLGRMVEVYRVNPRGSIYARASGSEDDRTAPLTEANLQKLYNRFNSIEEIKDLSQIRETIQISPRTTEFYAIFKGLKEFEKTFNPNEEEQTVIDNKKIVSKFSEGVYTESVIKCVKSDDSLSKPKNVVVVIDEINRGNVSQIFGELITLIEEDKRAGMPEALEVILPYSKEKFSIPPNLYIIGTMNTADRSVEALDTALRRRYTFTEMPPDYKVLPTPYEMIHSLFWRYKDKEWDESPYFEVEQRYKSFLVNDEFWDGDLKQDVWDEMKKDKNAVLVKAFKGIEFETVNLKGLLETMNKRIEKLIDKDHCIGHAYFMCLKDSDDPAEDLKTIFYNKIIPLLQEYFFGDYGKIQLVIGKAFFQEPEKAVKGFFADADYDDQELLLERKVYKIKKLEGDNFIEAVKNIYRNGKPDTSIRTSETVAGQEAVQG